MRTHCKRGHEFTAGNVYVRPDGGRECVTCRALWAKAHPDAIVAIRRRNISTHRESTKRWKVANREKVNAYMREYSAARPALYRDYRDRQKKPCPGCGGLKTSIRQEVCRNCKDLLSILVGASISREEIVQLVPDLHNQQLQRSYKCLKNSKKKLRQLQQQLSQTGKLEITTVLALLRETASALLAEC